MRRIGFTSAAWKGDRRWLDCLAAEKRAQEAWEREHGRESEAPLSWVVAEVASALALALAS